MSVETAFLECSCGAALMWPDGSKVDRVQLADFLAWHSGDGHELTVGLGYESDMEAGDPARLYPPR
jgi:hypothetical protein